MDKPASAAVYGLPPAELATAPDGAVQVSPTIPGAQALEEIAADSLTCATVYAPPGTVERRYVLAHALRALEPSGELTALAPKEKGGSRLGAELKAFGCAVEETGRRHHRICRATKPAAPVGVEEAIEAGAPTFSKALGRWTQPGLFSWDRPDPGTTLLIETLKPLHGDGAELGCGSGAVAQALLESPAVKSLRLLDIDRRAIEASRRNVEDSRATFAWVDARAEPASADLDFVVMNPPFHEGGSGAESRDLGQDFIRVAARLLRKKGVLWLVANRHLPYEGVLDELFASFEVRAQKSGFKVIEARK